MAPHRPPSPIFRKEQRCQTCCHCRTKLALLCMGNRCSSCRHGYCADCVVDTIEWYEIGVGFEEIIEEITPSVKRAWKQGPINVNPAEDFDVTKARTGRRKAPVLDSPSVIAVAEHEDGKYPPNRPTTNELLT
ncbi:MAG: hypothetical protein Q9216_005005 [Gyalolechia sp. 2 TL-2023]